MSMFSNIYSYNYIHQYWQIVFDIAKDSKEYEIVQYNSDYTWLVQKNMGKSNTRIAIVFGTYNYKFQIDIL